MLPTRAGAAPYTKRWLGLVDGIDLHYTASRFDVRVEAIARYQVGPNSQEEFPAIAYTLVVTHDGIVHWCHDLDVRCWHNGAPGHNSTRIGVCYTGDHEPNVAQLAALRGLTPWLEGQLDRALLVEGHKDHYATACPGPTWPSWRAALL